ncbi:MAG: iron-sulfur cluster assembly accessory protein, partial [Acidobacteria bacterium]|nr:iron-sulfur cluster assembly accessory protein [Acidobacteriota bacterium]
MIAVTDKASTHIQKLMAKQGLTEGGLRVGIKGGGCSGLSYTFSWEKEARLGDEVIEGPAGIK